MRTWASFFILPLCFNSSSFRIFNRMIHVILKQISFLIFFLGVLENPGRRKSPVQFSSHVSRPIFDLLHSLLKRVKKKTAESDVTQDVMYATVLTVFLLIMDYKHRAKISRQSYG